jgi:hypothetical protein
LLGCEWLLCVRMLFECFAVVADYADCLAYC